MDRKPLPQVEKQNEFFNSLRRKSTMSHSIATPDSSSSKSSIPEKLDEQSITVSASISTQNGIHVVPGNGDPCIHVAAGNGDTCKESDIFANEGGQNSGSDEIVIPDEEAAFFRMLGWGKLGCGKNPKYEALTEDKIKK
ncbi:hypothetical protein AAC387_Pa02g2462 [Persea americana]